MTVRNSDPQSSHDSAAQLGELAAKLRTKIVALARAVGAQGLTANEAERAIPEHKGHCVSPRFAELVERGDLVRVLTGYGKPTKRFPGGVPRYVTHFDRETRRDVILHWLPEFAPSAPKKNATSSEQPELPYSETEIA